MGWKDYLFAGMRVTAKLVPGISQAVEVVEEVQNRAEALRRHDETLATLTRTERSIVDNLRNEIRLTLEELTKPQLTHAELDEEFRNLNMIRQSGFNPYLFEGILANSACYDQVKSKPHLFGRVLADGDRPRDDAFYMFLDVDKTRILELPLFSLQQLLSMQDAGVPAARVSGNSDVIAAVVKPAAIVRVVSTPAPVAVDGARLAGSVYIHGWIEPSSLDRIGSAIREHFNRANLRPWAGSTTPIKGSATGVYMRQPGVIFAKFYVQRAKGIETLLKRPLIEALGIKADIGPSGGDNERLHDSQSAQHVPLDRQSVHRLELTRESDR